MTAAEDRAFAIPSGTVVLDKYRVEATLGTGSTGLVVKAVHTSLGTPVAIKFLLPSYAASSQAGSTFVKAAKAAAKISSEYVAKVFDSGSSHPYGPYFVMEYVDGEDLAKHLQRKGPLSIEAAIDVTVQAALALAEAHAAGVVHHNVKPANLIMTGPVGGASLIKVVDFGISQVLELAAMKTRVDVGASYYMSPEQISDGALDHRTDVYSLAVTLYELLTKTHPFTADSFADLELKVNTGRPTDIRQHRPEVAAEMSAVIAVAFSRKPEARYHTVGEFAAELAPWSSPATLVHIEALARREMRRSIGALPRSQRNIASQPPGAGPRAPAPALAPAAEPPESLRRVAPIEPKILPSELNKGDEGGSWILLAFGLAALIVLGVIIYLLVLG